MNLYYFVVNQRGERRSPVSLSEKSAQHWADQSLPYFEGEAFEVESCSVYDEDIPYPQIGDDGFYV